MCEAYLYDDAGKFQSNRQVEYRAKILNFSTKQVLTLSFIFFFHFCVFKFLSVVSEIV